MDQIKHLYHIKYLIENLERKKYKNINKIFILLIHLKREDFSDFSFISNVYDDYNQIFIDSLNGLNISIIDILNKNNKELFKIKELIDVDSLFEKNINSNFLKIDYQIQNISIYENNENYINELIKKLLEKNDFTKKIKETILNLCENNENLFNNFFNKNNFIYDELDLFTILSKYIINKYDENFLKLIIFLETDNALSSILMNNNKNDKEIYSILINIFENYFNNNIKHINEIQIENKTSSNKIKIIVGNNIPYLKNLYDEFNKLISKYQERFSKNEEMIKNEGEEEEEEKEEELNSIKSKYDEELQLINSEINEELKNKDILKNINNEKFKNLFFRDYFLFYLIKKDIKNEIKNIIDFIEYLYQLKNVSFVEFLLWFLNYSHSIDDMIQIYLILNKYDKNIIEEIKKSINENKFKFEISHRNKEYMRILNEKFTFILESFIYIMNQNFVKILNFDDKQKEIFFNDLNYIYHISFKIKNDLNLFIKELHSLRYILIILNNLGKII